MNAKRLTISRVVIALIMISAWAVAGYAETPKKAPKIANKNYQITIDGTATMVGGWACGGDAKIEAKPAPAGEPVPGLAAGVQKVIVTTSVPGIDCGDSTMNKHLRKALKDKQFPDVLYQATKYTLVDNGTAVQTSGELTIAGVTKPVALGAKLVPLPQGGGARVVGNVDIKMSEYGVKPPSLFFGTLKVADTVTVKFNAVVQLPQEMTAALFPNALNSN